FKKFDEYGLGRVALRPQASSRKFDGVAVLATCDSRMRAKLRIIGRRINKTYQAFLPAYVGGAKRVSRKRLRRHPHAVARCKARLKFFRVFGLQDGKLSHGVSERHATTGATLKLL